VISVWEPGPSLQGARVRSAVAVARSTRIHALPRERSAPRPRTRCTWGKTGRWAGGTERSTGGRTAARAPAPRLSGEPMESLRSRESSGSSPAAGACRRGGNGQSPKRCAEVITQRCAACAGRWRQCSHHHQCATRQCTQPASHQVAQPALHAMPDHGTTDRPTDHEPHPRRRIGVTGGRHMHDDGAAGRPAAPLHRRREVLATVQAGGSRQQRRRGFASGRLSGRQFAATLAAPRSHDGAPGPGPHAQPEPMSPRAATVVRLERALALGHGCRSPGARCSVLICAGRCAGSQLWRTAGGRSSSAGTGGTTSSGSHTARNPNGSWREHTRVPAGGRETSRAYGGETGAVKTSVSRHCGADTPLLR
jgi:hypothetical protein